MSDDEYLSLIQEGPAVVMVSKKEMLALLNRLKRTEEWAAFGKQAYHTLLCAKEESRNAYERLNFRITQAPND